MVLPKLEELKDFSAFDDSALIKLIAAKQPEALEVLYKRFGNVVFKRAFSLAHQADLAEKITLDVFLHVWENAPKYPKDRENVGDWLEKIGWDYASEILMGNQSPIGETNPTGTGETGHSTVTDGETNVETPDAQTELPAGLKKKLMHEVKRRKAILLER